MALFLKKGGLSLGKSWGQLEVFGRFPGALEKGGLSFRKSWGQIEVFGR